MGNAMRPLRDLGIAPWLLGRPFKVSVAVRWRAKTDEIAAALKIVHALWWKAPIGRIIGNDNGHGIGGSHQPKRPPLGDVNNPSFKGSEHESPPARYIIA